MKLNSYKRFALLAFALLLGLPCILCFVWVRKAQWQYALDRQLIAALVNNEAKQALVLVEAGADPNTPYAPPPSLNDLWLFWQHNTSVASASVIVTPASVTIHIPNPTAIQMACGERWLSMIDSDYFNPSGHFHPRTEEAATLVEAMLQHGADPDLGPKGKTPLQIAQRMHRPDLVALLRKYSKHP